MPEYKDIFVGPLIVLGVNEKNACWTSVPKEQIEMVMDFLEERSCEKGTHVNLETMEFEKELEEER